MAQYDTLMFRMLLIYDRDGGDSTHQRQIPYII